MQQQEFSAGRLEFSFDPITNKKKTKINVQSRGIRSHWELQMAKLFQTDSWRLRYTGSEVLALVLGCQRRRVRYSTSLGLSVLSFLMTGSG